MLSYSERRGVYGAKELPENDLEEEFVRPKSIRENRLYQQAHQYRKGSTRVEGALPILLVKERRTMSEDLSKTTTEGNPRQLALSPLDDPRQNLLDSRVKAREFKPLPPPSVHPHTNSLATPKPFAPFWKFLSPFALCTGAEQKKSVDDPVSYFSDRNESSTDLARLRPAEDRASLCKHIHGHTRTASSTPDMASSTPAVPPVGKKILAFQPAAESPISLAPSQKPHISHPVADVARGRKAKNRGNEKLSKACASALNNSWAKEKDWFFTSPHFSPLDD